jgi:hypothetical protein
VLDPLVFGWYPLEAEALVLVGAGCLLTALPTRLLATRPRRDASPDDRTRDGGLTHDPGERNLSRGAPSLRADLVQRRTEWLQIQGGERMSPAEVLSVKRVEVEPIRQEPARQRRPGEDTDAVCLREREDVVLRVAMKEAVLVLQASHRAGRKGALDRLDRMIRDAAVANLALIDEAPELAPRFLDRRGTVDVVELEELDVIGAKTVQAGLEVGSDRLGSKIHPGAALVRHRAALREEQDVVSAAVDRFGDDLLRATPAVERSRIDPVHTEVERTPDARDRVAVILRSPPGRPVASGADRRGSYSDRRDLQLGAAEPPPLHIDEATRDDPS